MSMKQTKPQARMHCLRKSVVACAVASLSFLSSAAWADTYAPWLTQLGMTDAIFSASNGGRGLILGVVDTGVTGSNVVFAPGQVSNALSRCAAVTFKCSNGSLDDNGHGTGVASIAAANFLTNFSVRTNSYAVASGSAIGLARNANIVAEKVLNASGSGYTTDTAAGIRAAADAGAAVINLSLTYSNTSDIAAAIDYAAHKGAFIVYAGGNDATALLANSKTGTTTTGLTGFDIQHLIFAGSLNASNVKSTFSNTPGAGYIQALSSALSATIAAENTGIFAGQTLSSTGNKVSYASRWIMAPGENILVPYYNATTKTWAWGQASGTSMAAPLVSASLLLLEGTWPILRTKGTAADLLLNTATAKTSVNQGLGMNIDATYGAGLLNLASAFQPYGGINGLSVLSAKGVAYPVKTLSGSFISSGGLGTLSAIQSTLAKYAAFDSYQRNFTVNLTGLVQAKPTSASLNALPSNPNTGPVAMKMQDGTEITYWQYEGQDGTRPANYGYAMITDATGNTTALGYGAPVQYSYAKALYGAENLADQAVGLDLARLSALAEGGELFSYGTKWGDKTRFAFAWSSTAPQAVQGLQANTPVPNSSNISVGVTQQLSKAVVGAATVSFLTEKNGVLGSYYAPDSAMSLGRNHTTSISVSAGVQFTPDDSLLAEVGVARTAAATGNGLLAGTTALTSQSYGMSFQHRKLWTASDKVTFSVVQPMRVTSGKVGVVVSAVDSDTGVPSFPTQWVDAAPSGHEVDYTLVYSATVLKTQALGLSIGYNKDAFQIQGNNQAHAGLTWSMKF